MNSINAAELARWTPIALDLEADPPAIEWADFNTLRFTEPMFFATVERWAAANPAPEVVRTHLDALAILDQAPSLDPCGLIFHLPRSGSTLVVQLLRQIPGCLVMSEPEPVNTLLVADPSRFEDDTQARILRLLIRSLGRRRFGDERYYVVKLTSWNVRYLRLFRRAFPATPFVWLQRNPAESMASLLEVPPRWLGLKDYLDLAASVFDLAPTDDPSGLAPATLLAGALAAQLRSASEVDADEMTVIDYSDLPDAAWTSIASQFGMQPIADDIARMVQRARLDSKLTEPRPFVAQPPRNNFPEAVPGLAAEQLDELYRALNARRTLQAAPRR
jgi:hypothetical protein